MQEGGTLGKRRRLSYFGDSGRSQRSQALPIHLPARIAVVSDSHSSMHRNTLPLLTEMAPDWILHAGDIGRLDVLSELETVAPTVAVRGNIDMPSADIHDDVMLSLTVNEQVVSRWLLTHIAVRGPRMLKPVLSFAKSNRISLVLCGHSHVPFLSQQDGVTVFNPGSVGPRRFNLPIVFGLITATEHALTCQHYDCESGEIWRP